MFSFVSSVMEKREKLKWQKFYWKFSLLRVTLKIAKCPRQDVINVSTYAFCTIYLSIKSYSRQHYYFLKQEMKDKHVKPRWGFLFRIYWCALIPLQSYNIFLCKEDGKTIMLVDIFSIENVIEIYTCNSVNRTVSIICLNNKDRYI